MLKPLFFGGARVAINFYVATNGNNANPGTLTAPFATVDGARSYLRGSGWLSASNANLDVFVLPGDYWQTSVTFTNDDSPDSAKLTYEALNGVDTVRLLGGVPVTGWVPYSGGIYRAAVSGDFWTIYENGERATLCRIPKLVPDPTYETAQEPQYDASTTHGTGSFVTFEYNPIDIPSTAAWKLNDVRLNQRVGGKDWWNDIAPIVAIDTVQHLFTLGTTPKYEFAALGIPRYMVENDLTFLTQQGEWYYDRNDNHGSPGGGLHYLYYWPNATPIADQEIVIPTTLDVISFAGADAAHPAKRITLKDLTIQYSDATSWWRYGDWGSPGNNPHMGDGHAPDVIWYAAEGATWAPFRHGAIKMENAVGLVVDGCKVSCAGLNGIYAYGYNGSHVIVNSLIENIGANGINFEGLWPGEGDINGRHVVDNCKTSNVSELVLQGAGVLLTNTGNNLLTHFECGYGRRDGVFTTIAFGIPFVKAYAKSNIIEYGYIHHHGQDSGDMGGIGFYGIGSQSGGPYAVNYVRQCLVAYIAAAPGMPDIQPSGFFFDNESFGQNLQNVNVTNTVTLVRYNGPDENTEVNVPWSTFNPAGVFGYGLRAGFPYP